MRNINTNFNVLDRYYFHYKADKIKMSLNTIRLFLIGESLMNTWNSILPSTVILNEVSEAAFT